jgi:Flp pilus assembly protein TadD
LGRRYEACKKRSAQENKGLRLRLRISSPKFAVLPWEFLFDPDINEYICLSANTPIVRYPEVPQSIKPITVEPPLRILVMMADPRDPDLAEIDFHKERQRISEAIKSLKNEGLVEVQWVSGQTSRDLLRASWEGPWHIFHFIGHGGFDPRAEEGVLVFCDEEGGPELLEARRLARILDKMSCLGLVFLNCCEGARASENDVFSSTAATLTQRNIPAVLAMQYEITDDAAIEFSRTFYETILLGKPIDTALTLARVAVNLHKKKSLEWGVPVLFMRSSDGSIFDIPEESRAIGKKKSITAEKPVRKKFGHDSSSGVKPKDTSDTTNNLSQESIDTIKQSQWDNDLSEIENQASLWDWYQRIETLDGLDEKNLSQAIKVGEAILAGDPDDQKAGTKLAEAYDRLGSIYKKQNRLPEAIDKITKAIKIQPAESKFYYHRAICHMKFEDYDASRKDFDEAIKISAKNSEYYWGRGLLYGLAARKELPWATHTKAVSEFDIAIGIEPKAHYYKSRCTAFRKLNKLDLAIENILQAIEIDPNNMTYITELAALRKIKRERASQP